MGPVAASIGFARPGEPIIRGARPAHVRASNCLALSIAFCVLVGASAAVGQTTPPESQPSTVSEVLVTGSRIAQPALASVSPVMQLTGEELRTGNTIRLEDAINALPQVFADQSSTVNNVQSGNVPGTATVNLRGLGAERT